MPCSLCLGTSMEPACNCLTSDPGSEQSAGVSGLVNPSFSVASPSTMTLEAEQQVTHLYQLCSMGLPRRTLCYRSPDAGDVEQGCAVLKHQKVFDAVRRCAFPYNVATLLLRLGIREALAERSISCWMRCPECLPLERNERVCDTLPYTILPLLLAGLRKLL